MAPGELGSMPGQIFSATVGTTSVLAVGPNNKRWGLMLLGPNTGRITIGTSSGVVLDQGPTLSNSMGVLELNYERMGDVLRGQIWAIGSAAGLFLGVVECSKG